MANGLKLCEPPKQREPKRYSREMGSGWFWCLSDQGWIVCYVNALWGARVDGHYLSMNKFSDVIGPLAPPKEI